MSRRCSVWLAAALAGPCLGIDPAAAAELPLRTTRGAALWSTPQPALERFLAAGSSSDRGLAEALHRTGWSAEEIRQAMNKLYSVDLAAVARFLASPAGEGALRREAGSYFPFRSGGRTGPQALRAAILADAADGWISSATILANLPTDMRWTPDCAAPAGPCPPLLTRLVFLPARIQAGQLPGSGAAGAPAAAAAAGPAGR